MVGNSTSLDSLILIELENAKNTSLMRQGAKDPPKPPLLPQDVQDAKHIESQLT